MRVLVTGGTGTVGSRVVERLVERGVPTRVLSRSARKLKELPAGVEGVVGDLEERSSLRELFHGCDRMFLLTALGPTEVGQGRNAAIVAAEVEMRHVVFLSVHRVEEGKHIPHFKSKLEIERVLNENGVPTTLVMPNNYFQNDLVVREAIQRHGVYPFPIGSTGIHRVDAGDVATAAVRLLSAEDSPGGRIPIVGPDRLDGPACAAIWSRVLDRDVRYGGDDLDAWKRAVAGSIPGWLVEDLAVMYGFFQEHGLVASAEDLRATRQVLGREPRSFESWARETAAAWR